MRRALGQGVEALFGRKSYEEEALGASSGEVKMIKTSLIEPRRDQPRKNFDREQLQALANSILEHGVIQPIIVAEGENGYYSIIAGERRWRASKLAGLSEMPAIVRTYDELQIAEVALIENLQREDLNPIEEAKGYRSLSELYHMTQEQIAESVGKSRPAIANAMRLLSLPEQIMDFVSAGELSTGHAKALMPLEKDDMLALANRVISEELTVRQTEALVKKMLTPKKEKEGFDREVVLALEEMEKIASEKVGNKVSIHHTPKNKGKVEIRYHSVAELEKIIDILKGGVNIG